MLEKYTEISFLFLVQAKYSTMDLCPHLYLVLAFTFFETLAHSGSLYLPGITM